MLNQDFKEFVQSLNASRRLEPMALEEIMAVNVKPKLGLNAYKVDAESHISINHDVCKTQCTVRFCTFVCPARVYTLGDDGLIHVEHDGCLECGTCVVACRSDALTWHYPRAGQGVQYRFG